MPNLKTEILGLEVEISYQKDEKNKLLRIINKFNSRIKEFEHASGQVTQSKIIYLAALKAEDYIEEIEQVLQNKSKEEIDYNNYQKIIENLTKEIILLKDSLDKLKEKNSYLEKNNNLNLKKIEKIEKILDRVNNKIINDDEN